MKSKITVQHLLTHTSGIYDYFDEDVIEDFGQLFEIVSIGKIKGPSDMLPLLIEGESYFEPGAQYKYCNSGFVILGMLIEVITEIPYSQYMSENVFKPLGLQRTGCYSTNQLPKNAAVGYIQNEDGTWKSNIFEIPMACTADGGLYATADDIQAMWNGLIHKGFLNNDMCDKALSTQAIIKDNRHYGLGFYVNHDEDDNKTNYFLVGGDPGVDFYSYYFIESDVILTILANTSDGAWELLKEVFHLVK